ncbi:alpha/beta fold hydrolase [Dyella koreensis]|uniref:alpha/beta fold hydrolase n=1 Tax=Dyella koreensis TaxID=311235 RepID=UPI00360B50F9
MVLLHSYLANAFMWTPQVQALETRYRVIVPDLWGHGSSGALPEGTHDLSALTRHVAALIDSLDLETYVVAGQSVGGMMAGELALSSPTRVKGLIMMGTYLGQEPAKPQDYFMRLLDRIDADGTFTPALLDEITALFFQSDVSGATPSLKASFQRQLLSWSMETLRQSILPIGRMIFQRRDLCSRLHELSSTPTLVMCGEHDRVRPTSESVDMAQRIGCRYIEVPGASHTSNLEQPEFVTRAWLGFLAEREARA